MKLRAAISSLATVLTLLAFGSGCGPSKPAGEDRPASGSTRQEPGTRFDPLDLPEDRTVVPEAYPRAEAVGWTDEAAAPTSEETVPPALIERLAQAVDTLSGQVFRIQLATTKLYGEAKRAAEVAEEIFDQPVFVDYEVPYFKVRVGGFGNRATAEDYQQRARTAGYGDAWVVMATLDIQEPAPLYDTTVADTAHGIPEPDLYREYQGPDIHGPVDGD